MEPQRRRELETAQQRLGIRFRSLALLDEALTHPSYAHERAATRPPATGERGEPQVAGVRDNQRLEFLGDAVLGLAAGHYLFTRLPDAPEGELARLRAAAVRQAALAEVARAMELGTFLRLGRGELRSGGAQREAVLADALEAVVGALFLDQGWEVARAFVERHLMAPLADTLETAAFNPKGALQERLQRVTKSPPAYRLLAAYGPDHAKTFVSEVVWEGRVLGRGEGRSKKEAEEAAAREALARLDASVHRPE